MTEPTGNTGFICTRPFRMGRGEFARTLFMQKGLTATCVLFLLFITGIFFGSLVDIRFLILSAMIVFIILPMVIGYLYYYHALGKYYHFNVVDHNIRIGDDALHVVMYFPVKMEKDADREVDEDRVNGDEQESVEYKTLEYKIRYEDLGRCNISFRSAIFPVGSPEVGFLWLPESAFNESGDFQEIIDCITQHTQYADIKGK